MKIKTQYNYPEALQWLQHQGKQHYGEKFHIIETDIPVIYLLLCYFLQDYMAAEQLNLDLQKGVLLTGPVGCGKTTLMCLMKNFASKNYIIKPCRDISYQFIQDGYEIIHRYSRGSLNHYMPQTFCFDDLGTETSMKYYGNECNVMAEILLTRYDLFTSRKLITHLTTNLSASEIENIYGLRVRSRLREMFNLIHFPEQTKDKRK